MVFGRCESRMLKSWAVVGMSVACQRIAKPSNIMELIWIWLRQFVSCH